MPELAVLHDRRPWLGLTVVLVVVAAACGSTHPSAVRAHRVVVPTIVGFSQTAAVRALHRVGLTTGVILGIPTAQSHAGVVIASNPSGGESVAAGATVSLTVSSGALPAPTSPTSPTTPSKQTACASGHVAYTESSGTGATCVTVGSTLTVTFVSSGGTRGYGSWSTSPPTISDNSVLVGRTDAPSRTKATAVFDAVGDGETTVTAQFDARCAPTDTTPCTVPPARFEMLTVTVAAG